jgi:hypothetical protein
LAPGSESPPDHVARAPYSRDGWLGAAKLARHERQAAEAELGRPLHGSRWRNSLGQIQVIMRQAGMTGQLGITEETTNGGPWG